MNTRWPEIGGTAELLRVQDADLALVHELMRERERLEQEFINGLQAIVDKHKPQPNEENREYTKALINAFEQEIRARSDTVLGDLPGHALINEEALTRGYTLVEKLQDAYKVHDQAYTNLLASRSELKKWYDHVYIPIQMPLVERKYRWSIHWQREAAGELQKWHETELSSLVASHHSALENTKRIMIQMINANISRATMCSRIYSRALDSVASLVPLNRQASIEGRMELERHSYAVKPVDYCNWFFDGQPSPLLYGVGIMTINTSPNNDKDVGLDNDQIRGALQWEKDGQEADSWVVDWFEFWQYLPLLPLNSSEFDRLKSAKNISRRDLPRLCSPDESAWNPLEPTKQKVLIKILINSELSERYKFGFLTLRSYSPGIMRAVLDKWDFEHDRPKPKEK